MRKVRHRGVCKVDWIFTFACAAYNLVRMRNLAGSSGGVSRRPTCVSCSIELEPEATKTPKVELFDISNDEQQKEKHAAHQFFSSLLEGSCERSHRDLLCTQLGDPRQSAHKR